MSRAGTVFQFAIISTIFIFVHASRAQDVYPITIKFPVTYYDFHSDGSNPDFLWGNNPATVVSGMVQPTLDADGLPIRGANLLYSYEIGKWFRPWRQGNDFEWPVYGNGGRPIMGMNTVDFDTSYKNIVILDTLTFTYVEGSPGVFEFTDTNFFPLDNKGFGNEGASHNYSFAAAMHFTMQHREAVTLFFQSCDDMWVFADRKLIADLGGLDTFRAAQASFDSITGSNNVASLPLDIFWTHRSRGASKIKLSTSIAFAPLCIRRATLPPKDTTIPYGDSLPLLLKVQTFCGTTVIDELDSSLVHWKLALPNAGSLRTGTGSSNTYYSIGAAGLTNFIIITMVEPSNPNLMLLDTITVRVEASPVTYHLYIEPDTNIKQMNRPDTVSLVSISQGDSSRHYVAAVLRDKFGNFVRFSLNAVWQVIGDTGIVGISTPDKPYLCAVTGLKPGTTYIRLSDDSGSVPDTVMVDNKNGTVSVRPLVVQNRLMLKATHEYYNLRGQKLQNYTIRHADGIVLERVIESGGRSVVRKMMSTMIGK
jgi:fibro-slime domain-containing protein